MVKLTKQEVRQYGNLFIEYLKREEKLKTWPKPELKQIYDQNYRIQFAKCPNFSTVLFHLSRTKPHVARVKEGYVYFKGTPAWASNTLSKYQPHASPQVETERIKVFKFLKASKRRDEFLTSNFVKLSSDPLEVEENPGYYTCNLQNLQSFDIQIENTTFSTVQLEKCLFLRNYSYTSLSDEHGCASFTNPSHVLIPTGCKYDVRVSCDATESVGSYCSDLFFRFTIPDTSQSFIVMRYVRFFKSDDIVDLLKPTAPYRRRKIDHEEFPLEVVPGVKPDIDLAGNKLVFTRVLPISPVPDYVSRAVERRLFKRVDENEPITRGRVDDQMLELLESDLTFENYSKKFSLLLHIEEKQAERDIRHYDLREVEVILYDNGRKFQLKVPGLAERRPSVLRGDRIYLRKVTGGGAELRNYEGYVHQVRQNDVVLGLNRRFHDMFIPGMKFNVRFTFNRLPVKLQHRAVAGLNKEWMRQMLFPKKVGDKKEPEGFVMYNRKISENSEQSLAVRSIVDGASTIPYIIYGPPGTGKTITMVETITQVVCKLRKRALICAPSNSACDLLVERLVLGGHIAPSEMFRMNALSRPWNDVPQDVKKVSNRAPGAQDYFYPPKEELGKFKVVATTLVTAGRLSSAEIGHFDFVFIDEAGHAAEPESMIAVDGLLGQDGRVVLAGDPEQLGPILRSFAARKYGLDISFLERMMKNVEAYQRIKVGYNHHVITKLLQNYRSHRAILEIPNELFYDNELQVCADQIIRDQFCHWGELPKRGFPIIFHGIKGEDVREEDSPSYFNAQEASIVRDYVTKLLESRTRLALKPEQIGIISPYRKQVEKLRMMLGKVGKDVRQKVKVGSVEEFQGQERRVIIVSTVRSNCEHLVEDEKFKLGFLRNPKRFNVAITRAMGLLIVVGNPEVLSLDYYWNSLLTYCVENGGYTGVKFESRSGQLDKDDTYDDVVKKMSSLFLGHTVDPEEMSELQEQVDPPWRDQI